MRNRLMTKILISGHGKFATGLMSNLALIAGENSDLTALDFNGTISLEEFSEQMEAKIAQLGEKVIILTDIKGGTPFNVAYRIKSNNPTNIFLFAGVNVPTALELLMGDFSSQTEEEVYQQLLRPELQLTRADIENLDDIEDEMD